MRSLIFVGSIIWALPLSAAEPTLHEQIDAAITAQAGGELAPRSSDEEFVRRVHLDVVGRIPTSEETRTFLGDTANDKRTKLIDSLLASPEHVERMCDLFHVMLMERLGEYEEWRSYLRRSFAENRPWNEMARDMLSPESESQERRAAAFFLSKRLENYGQNPVDVPALVRDVGRMFLGIDVQCAQCHDHLFVDEYKQEHYQGLYAFLSNVELRKNTDFPAVQEKPLQKKIEFMSVFAKEPKTIGPRLPGLAEIAIPEFAKGEEFEVPPDPKAKLPGVPKFRTLKSLAESAVSPENSLFAKNAVNRLWRMLMGRGLVEPLDLQHAGNPPSHPALFELLASDFRTRGYDLRSLMRELLLSETYQRSGLTSDASILAAPPQSYRLALEKPLSSEQWAHSLATACGEWPQCFIEGKFSKELQELRTKCVKAFAAPEREPETEHAPSVKGALFTLNDPSVIERLKPQGDRLIARLLKIESSEKLAEEMYLAVLSRHPTDDESAAIKAYSEKYAATEDRPAALGRLVWSLLASNEFASNH